MLTAVCRNTLPLRIFHHFAESLDTYFIHFTKLGWKKMSQKYQYYIFLSQIYCNNKRKFKTKSVRLFILSFPKNISNFIRIIEQKKYVGKILNATESDRYNIMSKLKIALFTFFLTMQKIRYFSLLFFFIFLTWKHD